MYCTNALTFVVLVCDLEQTPQVTGSVVSYLGGSTPHGIAGTTVTWICPSSRQRVIGDDTTICQADGTWSPDALGYCGKYWL